MLYYLIFIIVILEAMEDGLFFKGHKSWAKRVEVLYKILMFGIFMFVTVDLLPGYAFGEWNVIKANWHHFQILLKYWFVLVVLWAFIRAAFFDPIMHLISGFDQDMVGKTSPVWNWIMKYLSGWKVWVFRGGFLGLSIFWYLMAVKRF